MGLIQMLGKVNEQIMHFETPEPLGNMTYTEMAAHSLDFWLQSEDLPDLNNRIYYDDRGNVNFDPERRAVLCERGRKLGASGVEGEQLSERILPYSRSIHCP